MGEEYRVVRVDTDRVGLRRTGNGNDTVEIERKCVYNCLGEEGGEVALGQIVYLSQDRRAGYRSPVAFRRVSIEKSLIWPEERRRLEGVYDECAEIRGEPTIKCLLYAVIYWIRGNEAFKRENRLRLEQILRISYIPELDFLENIEENQIFDTFQWPNAKSAYQSLISKYISAFSPLRSPKGDQNATFQLCSEVFNLHIRLKSIEKASNIAYSSGEQYSLKVKIYEIRDWKVVLLPKEGFRTTGNCARLWHMVAAGDEVREFDEKCEEIGREMAENGGKLANLMEICINSQFPTALFLLPEIRPQIQSFFSQIDSNPAIFPTSLISRLKKAQFELESREFPCSSCQQPIPYQSLSHISPRDCLICLSCSANPPTSPVCPRSLP